MDEVGLCLVALIIGIILGLMMGAECKNDTWKRKCVTQDVAEYVANDKGESVWQWKDQDGKRTDTE